MTAPAPKLEFHPLANLFPLMEGEEFDRLVADIREHGLRNGIMLHEGKILDGRNRYRACLAAGVEPVTVPWREDWGHHGRGGALGYVLSANLHRRHLTTQQRAAIAAELATMKQGARTDLGSNEPRLSNTDAAKAMKVSPASVKRAKKVMKQDPAAHAQAKAGTLPRERRVLRQNLGQARAEAFEQRHPELLAPPKKGLFVYLFDSADEILRDMAKVAKRAEQGDETALRHIIDGAKLLMDLCLRIERFAQDRVAQSADGGEASP